MLAIEGTLEPGNVALLSLLFSVGCVVISALVTLVVLIRLPENAFSQTRPTWPRSLPRLVLRVGMNVLGWALILLGVVLSIPGVPGQGILTVLMGLLLVDFPGRGRLLRKLLSRPTIRGRVDRMRARFGRPPFTA